MAVVTVSGNPVVGAKYSVTTASSADWTSVSNSTYFFDLTDQLVYYKNSSGAVVNPFAGGGLTYFSEAQNTTAPNATVPVDSLTAVTGTTNGDFAIIPKGTGATLAQIPDGTATGGNKRGIYAIDFQRLRPASSYVASGSYATILNGQNNTASGNYSFSSGLSCNSSGTYSFCFGDSSSAIANYAIALGQGATASGGYSFALNSTASGANSFSVAGGTASGAQSVSFGNNTSSSDYTFAQGSATTASGGYSSSWGVRSNTFNHASRKSLGCIAGDASINASGASQRSWLNVATNTTTATPKSLNAYNGTPTISLNLQNNNAMRVKGSIIGKQTGSTNVGAWDFDCVIVRGTSAATTVIAGTPTISLIVNTGGFGTPTLTANTSEGGLDIKVTGLAGISINWNGTIDSCETIIA